jgi:gamma-tubulin complex component 3
MAILLTSLWRRLGTSLCYSLRRFCSDACNRPSLSRPANTLYRHNLTATLETAIRSSNAQNDPPDVLRRLDARMLEYSHGEMGWDVFTLEYKVDAPIDTVLDPDSMIKYQKLFNHLWKMRRIEGALSAGWMRIAGGSRTFLRVPGEFWIYRCFLH